ncbi:hypothetical protein RB595_001147 [Gaeumannomyces hyphopodioides]
MAAVGQHATEPAGYKSSNTYLGLNNPGLARKLAERNVENSIPYILPVLNSLPADFTLIDVGCGPCSITIDIAQRYPRATILGLDSPDALAIAKDSIKAAGVTNITLVAGDALDLRAAADSVPVEKGGGGESLGKDLGALLRNGGFDVAHTHQVMLHVQDPARLMLELRGAVKKRGGVVCCRDAEIGSMIVHPNSAVLSRFFGVIPAIMSNHGADPEVGRKHLEYALKAGFKRSEIEISVGQMLASTPEERKSLAELFLGGSLNQADVTGPNSAFIRGGLKPDAIYELLRAWREWVEIEYGWCFIANAQVVCRRNA